MNFVKKVSKLPMIIAAVVVLSIGAFVPFQTKAFAERCAPDHTKVCASGFFEEDGYLIGWIISGRPLGPED